jgi:primary-amine oxidase
MKLSNSCFFVATILLSVVHPASTLPNPRPKQPWVKQYAQERAKKAMLKSAGVSRRWTNETQSPCDSAYPITAPKENVWGGLTDVEAAGVASWLFAQTELNLTVSEEAGEWDNHM